MTVDAPGPLSRFDERFNERSTAHLVSHILELDEPKCSWGPRRLRLVGTFRGVEQANVTGTVLTRMQWMLSTVRAQARSGSPYGRCAKRHDAESSGWGRLADGKRESDARRRALRIGRAARRGVDTESERSDRDVNALCSFHNAGAARKTSKNDALDRNSTSNAVAFVCTA